MSIELIKVKIAKLVHGGQGLGVLPDGRKCFVWGALPDETVTVKLIKNKKDWAEAIIDDVIVPSKDRISPKEPNMYLATSPWQILGYKKELHYKQAILSEVFEREKLKANWQPFFQPNKEYGYRNKMEYAFWWDNESKKTSLALRNRGSHQKTAVCGSVLATEHINLAGQKLVDYINQQAIPAIVLKSVIIRSSASGQLGISIFTKNDSFLSKLSKFELPKLGYEVVYSNPKSPASIVTEILLAQGQEYLSDKLLGKDFRYTTRSFFQNNLEPYEIALQDIKDKIDDKLNQPIVDIFCGVGSIGLSVAENAQKLTMVESDNESARLVTINAKTLKINNRLIVSPAEYATENINIKDTVILDPPRAGLHKDLRQALVTIKPNKIIYLSCNPSTQARDVAELTDAGYKIIFARGYNFFPRTPHTESLIVLERQ